MAYRKRRYEYFRNAGFLPKEAQEFAHITKAGLRSAYVRKMVAARRGLLWNAKRYGWSATRYREEITQMYKDRGAYGHMDKVGRIYPDPWKYLRWYEETYPPVEPEYQSPWRKKIVRHQTKREEKKRITRKQMVKQWLADLDLRIARTQSENYRKQLETQREEYKALLSKLEGQEQYHD